MNAELVISALLGGLVATLLSVIVNYITSRTQKLRRLRGIISDVLSEAEVARHSARDLQYDRLPDPRPAHQLFSVPKLSRKETSELAISIYHGSMEIFRASQNARLHLKDAESAKSDEVKVQAELLHSNSLKRIEEKMNPLTHHCEELIASTRKTRKYLLQDV